jgi:ribosomal protein S18 acetylase RimI-like enzyme
MTTRRATEADAERLRALWEEFCAEVPEPPGFEDEPWEEEWEALRRDISGGAVYVAEADGQVVGVAQVSAPVRGAAHLVWAHTAAGFRRRGIVKSLLREAVRDVKEQGARTVSLEALKDNAPALAVWRRLGFEEVEYFMATPLERLEARLTGATLGASRGAVHVQSDDMLSVERALHQFVPRFGSPDVRTSESWIRIGDELLDDDRELQARLARELSERLGAVVVALGLEHGAVVRFRIYERGRMVDEYLSVPTFYGDLPKGDELALAANPTLVSRLTGADRERLRRVARNAAAPAELPPALELYEELARVMGLEP